MFLRKTTCLLALLLPAGFSWAVSWSVLPVRTVSLTAGSVKSGPELLPDPRSNGSELARIMVNYLKITGYLSVSSPARVEQVTQKLQIRPDQKITRQQLRDAGTRLDSDQLLLTTIIKARDEFQIESKVYYTASQQISDQLVTRHADLWVALGNHIDRRFKTSLPKSLKSASKRPLLLVIDSSGSNYNEVARLKKIIPRLNTGFSAACSVNGEGKLSYSSMAPHPARIQKFLNNLRPAGGGNYLVSFDQALECAIKQNPYRGSINDTPRLIILVSGSPDRKDEGRIDSLLRKLSYSADVLILGSSSLTPTARSFWQDMVRSIAKQSQVTYHDVLYRQSVGLVDGSSWYIFKRGFEIIESRQRTINPGKAGISIPSHLRKNFKAGNLLETYKSLSKNKVVNAGKVEVLLKNQLLSFTGKSGRPQSNDQQGVRVLLEINGKPFWISLPRSAVYNRRGQVRIKKGERYYFLLNLEPARSGIPLVNNPGFGHIYSNRREISRLFFLPLADYLKRPGRYLGRSIASTSLYALYGTVKLIRFTEKDVIEQ